MFIHNLVMGRNRHSIANKKFTNKQLATKATEIIPVTPKLIPNTPVQNFLCSGCLFKQNNNNLIIIIYNFLIIYNRIPPDQCIC